MINIIIFGTGEFGKDAYHYYKLREDINIIAFSDNNMDKHNTMFFEKRIISPFDIKDTQYDQIVIASSFDNEIYQQLIEMEIFQEKIMILNLNQIKVQLNQGDKLALAQQLMLDISNLFNQHSIPYHIDHGTLLGIIRDESLMPWDIDVDFASLSTNKDEILKVLNNFLSSYSVSYCKNNNWKATIHSCNMILNKTKKQLPMVIKIFNDADDSTSNSFFVDVELKYEQDKKLYWMVGSRKLSVLKDICFPTASILFKGKSICIPKDTNSYLVSLYGDWKKVVKEWSYDQYSNIQDK